MAIPAIMRLVAIGRRMKVSEKFTANSRGEDYLGMSIPFSLYPSRLYR